MPMLYGHMTANDSIRSARRSKAKAIKKGYPHGLSIRAGNAIRALGVETREGLAEISHSDILRIPNCGRATLAELIIWMGEGQ